MHLAVLSSLAPCLFGLSLSAQDPAALSTPPIKSIDRFALKSYPSQGRAVWVAPSLSAIVVRTRPEVAASEVTLAVEEVGAALAAKGGFRPELCAAVANVATRLRRDGLWLVELTHPVARRTLAELADGVASTPGVVQAYPVLTRGSGRAFADDHLVLIFAPGRLNAGLEALLPVLSGTLVRRSSIPDVALVAVGPRFANDAVEAARFLTAHRHPDLVAAEPDLYREYRLQALTNDPKAATQWHLYRDPSFTVPGTGQIFAPQAWDVSYGDPAVVIAVVDTGIDILHEDLSASIVGGFDAASADPDPSPDCSPYDDGRGVSPTCPTSTPYRESHGTATSGLAAGNGNNGIGITGVCPMCSLMPIRYIGGDVGTSLTTAETFTRAVTDGAWVINNSWGAGYSRFFPLSQTEVNAVVHARLAGRGGKGTVILFAAGNETSDVAADAYARRGDIIAVAASTNLDDWSYYSNYGEEIDIAAPSLGGAVSQDSYGIVTTDVTGADGYDPTDYDADFGGTSASSPIAAGLAGLILSVNPDLTADQVRLVLTSTADKIRADKIDWLEVMGEDIDALWAYDDTGHSLGFGFGRINAAAAAVQAQNPSLQGALCTAPGCPHCDVDGRCQIDCGSQADCPDGSICRDSLCSPQLPKATDIGEPCTEACEFCLPTYDSDFQQTDICTATCQSDDDCPSGFDCRLTALGGVSLCAVGVAVAGEPADFSKCIDDMAGAQVRVLGSDSQPYCTDLCAADVPGACPYLFHCGMAACDCTRQRGSWCVEYTCREVSNAMAADWPFSLCFANPGFGVDCATDTDCKLGDYCGPDGKCRVDDRDGCLACAACSSSDECGPRGRCMDLGDGSGSRCIIPCVQNPGCPGNAACVDVPYRNRTIKACGSASPGANGESCDPAYTCTVGCRDDRPCPEGQICTVVGECYTPPPPPPDDEKGCACGPTAPGLAGPALFAAPMLLMLGRARRRRSGV
ncbi:MAG: S8 family serine peptidase [Deltaproteobacteria bacterium]|nr:S8 family serine peptidase [Deltaproteobacteria bacterium]